jgi:uncharacterized protein (TIGR03435 family)
VLAISAALATAQNNPVRPMFEAASVRQNTSGSSETSANGTQSQIVYVNQTLKRLIERAYNLKPLQIVGPAWLEDVHFDITAKYPAGTKNEDRPLMLRALLEDSLGLVAHHETRELPGYALIVAKGGFKLKPVEQGGIDITTTGDRVRTVTARKTSMAVLADLVARNLSEMVVNNTGIDGVYDFELRWINDLESGCDAGGNPAPSLYTALQETLGLRLQSQKVPVDMVVVDHANRVPTEN